MRSVLGGCPAARSHDCCLFNLFRVGDCSLQLDAVQPMQTVLGCVTRVCRYAKGPMNLRIKHVEEGLCTWRVTDDLQKFRLLCNLSEYAGRDCW